MLISFTLENWMSFRDEVTFSMVASRERQHGERVPRLKKYGMRVLPIAALYGGNASGKSNLIQALDFARSFVYVGVPAEKAIPVEPYLLDAEYLHSPSHFCFEILVRDTIFEFSFAVNRTRVTEEKLVKVASSSEKVLYHRKGDEVSFSDSLEDKQRLKYVFEGTQDNQLFLSNSVSQKINTFQGVFGWFKDTLQVIETESLYAVPQDFLDDRHPLHLKLKELLPRLDTGIEGLVGEDIPIEALGFTSEQLKDLIRELDEGESITFVAAKPGIDSVIFTLRDGALQAKRILTSHLLPDGSRVNFRLSQESDGTRRAINLIPAITGADNASEGVYFIDELDRSMHSLLTKRLLEVYLNSATQSSRGQLIFTTHDVQLMDQNLLRRDEMWVTERDQDGASSLIAFSDFKDVRYDKDIRKSYLHGRLGGIPKILATDLKPWAFEDQKEKNPD